MLNRSSAPPSFEVEKFHLPAYQTYAVTDLAHIYTVEDHNLPVLQMEFVFESGKGSQTVPGTSYYAIKMLPEGTLTKSANDISFGFESLGSFVEWSSGLDHTHIKVYCQSQHALKTLDLLEEVLTQPSFPLDNFEVLKKIRSQQIKQQEAKNSQLATAKFNQQLFGESHPIGRRFSPEEALQGSLTDVTAYYEHVLFNKPKVFVTGAASTAVISRIERLLLQLPSHRSPSSEILASPTVDTVVDERENSQQVSYRAGMLSLTKRDPNFHRVSIANSLFGGFFGSRLMQKIREELGYTYGIYSTFVHTLHQSYWMIGSELIKAHAAHGVEAIEEELQLLALNPPEKSETQNLKSYLKGKLLSSMDSLFSRGSIIKGLKLSGLPDTYYDDYFAAIDQITVEDISQITKEYLLEPKKTSLLLG